MPLLLSVLYVGQAVLNVLNLMQELEKFFGFHFHVNILRRPIPFLVLLQNYIQLKSCLKTLISSFDSVGFLTQVESDES